jgi:hypothetical protein
MGDNPEVKRAADLKVVEGPDPFDPKSFRLPQTFTEGAAVKKLLTTLPVRKPDPQTFVRVHPGEDYRTTAALLNMKDDREHYLVTPTLVNELAEEVVPVTLFTAISRQGVLFLWPVRLPGPDGKTMTWWSSAREAAELAMKLWVRVKANQPLGAYDIAVATGSIPEPDWPEHSFRHLLHLAFRDYLIDRADHPVIQRLRGSA